MSESQLGFGTEYEKFVLRQIVEGMMPRLKAKSICEYPSNNLMGDNSEIFNGYDLKIEKLSEPMPISENRYDLVWNFCETEQREDPFALIDRMLLLTRKYLLIVLQNKRNFGVLLHKTYHKLTGRTWDHGNIGSMTPEPFVKFLARYGKIVEMEYFDAPWFILDIYECGSFLKRIIPSQILQSRAPMKKSLFENTPAFCKRWLAHHSYILFEKC